MNSTHCFFQPPTTPGGMGTIVDFINPENGLSHCSSEDWFQVAARYPGTEVWLIREAIDFREQAGRTEPVEITLDQWRDALEILPPANWHRAGAFESFQSCEHFSGRLTATYLRRGGRAWMFTDLAGMSLDDIVAKVRQRLGATAGAEQAA